MRKSDKKNSAPETQSQMIMLSNKSQGEKQFLISDIVYCQSDNTKVHVWFLDRGHFTITCGLAEFEELLKPYGFFRLQQSFLININHVDSVRRADKDIIMKHFPNVEISASRDNGRWDAFIAAWEARAIWPRKEYKISETMPTRKERKEESGTV